MYIGELIVGGVGILTTGASAWISYFFTRKKYHTEVDSNVIKNLEESLKFYEDLTKHNKEQLKELMEENKTLRQELNEVRKQLQELTTNLYLDEAFKNRIKTREDQLKNRKDAKDSNRTDRSENPNRRRPKSSDQK